MNRLITLTALSLALAASSAARGQESAAGQDDPFSRYDEVSALATRKGYQGIKIEIKSALSNPVRNAQSYLRVAELMKRAGDVRAEAYYVKAIEADSADPAYELFYADYLRNVRGAGRPLFSVAEKHYFRAMEKLGRIEKKRAWDEETRKRVERGLVALYQQDGLPVIYTRRDDGASTESSLARPFLFFGSINRLAQLTGDFDNADDIRSFTSEALLAASRRNADLSEGELLGLARVKNQGETFDRFRLRFGAGAWPVVDLSYRHREIARAQVTNFFDPRKLNDVYLNEYGVSVEKSLGVGPYFDLFMRGGYEHVSRKGLIEFLPGSRESVNQFEMQTAASRFVGPDKAILEAAYVFQDINQAVPVKIRRDRHIAAATFTYQLLRFSAGPAYRNRFDTRGIHIFAGTVNDRERFGSVALVKHDYFVGASLKGLGTYEVTIQPTIFTARVAGDPNERKNSQYRTNLSLLWRIKDEEEEPGLPDRLRWLNPAFIHLALPFKYDVAIRGPKEFENYNVGVALHAKFFRTGARRATFLTSAGYNFQRFPRLNKNLNLLSCSFSMGF
ncbi:MAG TPA: hypothetical protein VHU19_18470 [Pyrinomonadaceae bacterium]|nr:hypothetical protein [Pyrinomonadaceae bacterium]